MQTRECSKISIQNLKVRGIGLVTPNRMDALTDHRHQLAREQANIGANVNNDNATPMLGLPDMLGKEFGISPLPMPIDHCGAPNREVWPEEQRRRPPTGIGQKERA